MDSIFWKEGLFGEDSPSQHERVVVVIAATLVLATGTLWWSYMAVWRYLHGSSSSKNRPWKLVPGCLPVVGHFHLVQSLKNLPLVVEPWADEYGQEHGCFDIDLAGKTYTVICSKDRTDEILKHRPKNVYRSAAIRESSASVGAKGLFQAEGQQWMIEHKLVASTLNRKSVQDYLPIFKDLAQRLISKWTDGIDQAAAAGADDASSSSSSTFTMAADDDLTRLSADSISRFGMGRDFDFLNNPKSTVGDDVCSVLMGAFSRALMPLWYWRIPVIGHHLDGLGFAIQRMHRLLNKLVNEYEEKRSRTNINPGTTPRAEEKNDKGSQIFLDKLYALMESEKVKLARERVTGNVLTLFLAGSDTTPKSLTCAMYVLAKDQDLQKELQEEVASFDLEQASVADLLEQLPRLKSFLHEIQRYYANPVLLLQTQKEIEFCGGKLPKDAEVMLLPRYLMRSEHSQVTEIPLGPEKAPIGVFCPTRYLVSDPIAGSVVCIGPAYGSYGSAGFGIGTRHCPGRTYSEALSLCVLISLLQTIDIALVPGQREPKFVYDVLTVPDYPVQLTLTKKKQTNQ